MHSLPVLYTPQRGCTGYSDGPSLAHCEHPEPGVLFRNIFPMLSSILTLQQAREIKRLDIGQTRLSLYSLSYYLQSEQNPPEDLQSETPGSSGWCGAEMFVIKIACYFFNLRGKRKKKFSYYPTTRVAHQPVRCISFKHYFYR